ncbi:MAG: hypothetical protein Q8L34_01485 [Candidatus Woesearchaeota archaeon]|nr:hypothetical protein [Candidatus Woesearchaeota archaeon]
MGSQIEFNDTLKISKARGFPVGLNLEDHLKTPAESQRFVGRTFTFWNPGERIYPRPPTRVFLVEEMPKGDWLYWGHVHIVRQTMIAGKTSGDFKIVKIYDPEYQRLMTKNEAPEGKSYFLHL